MKLYRSALSRGVRGETAGRLQVPAARSDAPQRVGAALWLMLVVLGAHAASVEPGVSRALATSRAARLSELHYGLEFELTAHAATMPGTETLSFVDGGTGDLALDFRDGTILSVVLNGKPLPVALENGHLNLPGTALLKGRNELKVKFMSQVAAAAKALTRYEDRDDGSEYLYTLFVPMDASMAFPCFDQPDLKARFTLSVSAPLAWSVISNTAGLTSADGQQTARTSFEETRPISTYLFAFAAGPFAALPGAGPGQPTVYVRKSQLARARQEAPQVQQIAARGIAYLSEYFAQPFPFPKYDLVLIPGFPFGGMEHAGATFLNEDGVLFRTAPTASDFFRRNILVLHETCHQWFGDLVTMRWFDDLWLKEGFAQYMAYKALARLEPEENPWKHFYEEIKPLAYGIDETRGTTPIFQNIANLKDAKSAYGAIVYQKAPAVLKQLEYRIGEDAFRDGLRLYLKQHAYGNAQWSDLIGAFEAAGGARVGASRDSGAHPATNLKEWAAAWIEHRGMPQVEVTWSCASGKIKTLVLHQRDVLPEGYLWPMASRLTLDYYGKPGMMNKAIKVDWKTADHAVDEAVGSACPSLIFANSGDYGYGRFLLDAHSEKTAARELLEAPAAEQDPLERSQLWGALWDNVHVAQSAPSGYVELALQALPAEGDESLARIQGGRVATALHAYLSAKGRAVYTPRLEAISADRMLRAPTPGLRIVSFRTFTGVAETPPALAQVKGLLSGTLIVPGMPLKPLDRWNLIGHLIAMGDPEAAALFAAEQAKDHSGEGQKYAYAVEAGSPDRVVKARYFAQYLQTPETRKEQIQEDWITQSLRPFNSWNQTSLTEPYLARALDALPGIKQHRKIFFLGAWLGAFLEGQHSAEAQSVVHAWLGHARLDADLRLKVLEVSDALDRTVMIRQRFPQ